MPDAKRGNAGFLSREFSSASDKPSASILALSLAGCGTAAFSWDAHEHEQCTAMGYKRGTPVYLQCRSMVAQARVAQLAADAGVGHRRHRRQRGRRSDSDGRTGPKPAFRRRQSGGRAPRRTSTRRSAQTHRQRGGAPGGDRLLHPAQRPRTLDPELLAMIQLTEHADLSRETVRRRLAENHLKPWRKEMWCIPQIDGTYVARMEDVLDLYAEAPDLQRPVVCFDESPTQLIGEARQPISAMPGQLERYDCEYRRNGTANLFVLLDAHRPWRKVKVTEHRMGRDFAQCMRELVDIHYPQAEHIRVVLDNLLNPFRRRALRDLPGAGSSTVDAPAGVPLRPQSTLAGSTWSRSRSASWPANVSIDASTATPGSSPKPPPGRNDEMPNAPASTGCSQPKKPAPNASRLISGYRPYRMDAQPGDWLTY